MLSTSISKKYNLPNGLHVILHRDNSAPIVTTSVMYHAGAKDEANGRTGFAHFFEHLLLRGQKILSVVSGLRLYLLMEELTMQTLREIEPTNYETFPSNNEQLGLWMEDRKNETSSNQPNWCRYTERCGERGEKNEEWITNLMVICSIVY